MFRGTTSRRLTVDAWRASSADRKYLIGISRGANIGVFITTTCAPLVIIGAMWAMKLCGLLHRLRVWRTTIYLLFLWYPRICETIIQAFRCHQLNDVAATQLLMADMAVVCDHGYKVIMWSLASFFMLLYAVGVPSLFFWRLRMHQELLHLPGPKWQLGFLCMCHSRDP